MKKIAFYDMDKTITRSATYAGFLRHIVTARAPWRVVMLPFALIGIAAYSLRLLGRSGLKTFNQRLFLGSAVGLESLSPHLESHADNIMANNAYDGALAQIAQDKADGYTLVLATASYELYVQAIADRLGFDHVLATRLVVDDAQCVRPQIIGENCYDKAKLARIDAWMAEHIGDEDRSKLHIRAYSDHISDMPMLELADEAFATNPHPPLRAEAQRRGWTIFDW